jgi:very-short-patch-repair endonuclease
LRVLRFPGYHVENDLPAVLQAIRTALRDRAD